MKSFFGKDSGDGVARLGGRDRALDEAILPEVFSQKENGAAHDEDGAEGFVSLGEQENPQRNEKKIHVAHLHKNRMPIAHVQGGAELEHRSIEDTLGGDFHLQFLGLALADR